MTEQQLARCADRPDGELCELDGTAGQHCDRGVCIRGSCGDGVTDSTEECDLGAANDDTSSDTCRTTCRVAGCGDGVKDSDEACDNGTANSSTTRDACRESCILPRCGDFVVDTGELCDDGNTSAGDGCSPTCSSSEMCGNGLVEFTVSEVCDDGNTTPNDGCNATCQPEAGFSCSGEPTTCTPTCGDGAIVGSEMCDDANLTSGDGCNNTCMSEMGWNCTGAPSTCTELCGDSVVVGDELCDDGGTTAGDGCSAVCLLEFCGNGALDAGEECDDGNNLSQDGCSPDCLSNETCGNGVVDFAVGEQCDDGALASDDGCTSLCKTETHWSCIGQPSVCSTTCGDGFLVDGDGMFVFGPESCDDANAVAGDGCSATCQLETGWQCIGVPKCTPVCGDGLVRGSEFCDDANFINGDGCDATCHPESKPPRLLAVVDTSGSMNWNTCSDNSFTGGDGSSECPGSDVAPATCNQSASGNFVPDDSRIYAVKEGLKNVILSGSGSAEWALMRFAQTSITSSFACPTLNATEQSGGWLGADSTCTSTTAGTGNNAGQLLVSWPASGSDNTTALLSWMDHQSAAGPAAGFDDELRGTGTTPLAGSLITARSVVTSARTADTFGACRPYVIILITDGAETCGGNPVAAASSAYTVAGIPIHVVSMVTDPAAIPNHNAIASAGGTTQAIVAIGGDAVARALLDVAGAQTVPESCNGLDDDCDSYVDDEFPDKGKPCDNGRVGTCRRTGVKVCSADGKGTTCSANSISVTPAQESCNGIDDDCDGVIDDGIVPACGTCTNPMPSDLCNGLDDDCDGKVDEDSPGDMIAVGGFYIDKYEASRADATNVSVGNAGYLACSAAGRLPWLGATHAEAGSACAAQGKRLCTEAEWQQACGAGVSAYPYGNSFSPMACNGRENDSNCATPADDNTAVPTGTAHGCPTPGQTQCVGASGTFDMSGNVAEWTSTLVTGKYVVRGGSYSSIASGLRCDFDLVAMDPKTSHADLGFRCCSSTFPP